MPEGLLAGVGVGVAVATSLYLVRRFAWTLSLALGWGAMSLGLMGCLALALVSFLAIAKGGEGVTAGMTALVLLVLAILVAIALPLLVAAVQYRLLSRKFWETFRSIILEPVAVGAAVWMFQLSVTNPIQTNTTSDWWRREQARRARIEKALKAIPKQYREYTPTDLRLDAFNRAEIAKRGFVVKPAVPFDVQRKLQDYWSASSEPEPIPDRSRYSESQDQQRNFAMGAGGAWLLVALVIPFCLRRPNSETSIQSPPIVGT